MYWARRLSKHALIRALLLTDLGQVSILSIGNVAVIWRHRTLRGRG